MLWDSLQKRIPVDLSSVITKTNQPFQIIQYPDFVELRTLSKSYLFRKDLYRALIFVRDHGTFRVGELKGLKLDRDKVELMNILKNYALVAVEW